MDTRDARLGFFTTGRKCTWSLGAALTLLGMALLFTSCDDKDVVGCDDLSTCPDGEGGAGGAGGEGGASD